jgi:hypothetical protein
MTPFHTDLMKHSTPAAPTEHERQARRVRRQIRRAAVSALIEGLRSRLRGVPVAAKRPRVDPQS